MKSKQLQKVYQIHMQVFIQDISAKPTVRKGHLCETNNEATLEKEKLSKTQNENISEN